MTENVRNLRIKLGGIKNERNFTEHERVWMGMKDGSRRRCRRHEQVH